MKKAFEQNIIIFIIIVISIASAFYFLKPGSVFLTNLNGGFNANIESQDNFLSSGESYSPQIQVVWSGGSWNYVRLFGGAFIFNDGKYFSRQDWDYIADNGKRNLEFDITKQYPVSVNIPYDASSGIEHKLELVVVNARITDPVTGDNYGDVPKKQLQVLCQFDTDRRPHKRHVCPGSGQVPECFGLRAGFRILLF